jgi:hypothetical protein
VERTIPDSLATKFLDQAVVILNVEHIEKKAYLIDVTCPFESETVDNLAMARARKRGQVPIHRHQVKA